VTTPEIEILIEQYRAGLEAELALLAQLDDVSEQQRRTSAAGDIDALNRVSDVRDRLTTALVAVEDPLRAIRHRLKEHQDQALALPGYGDAVERHHQAVDLVTRILNTDQKSLESLASAELARRDAVRALEHGETTLAAYRKVVTLAAGATLVDRRG